MNNILKLIRVKHWVKNGLVFFPLVFSGLLFDLDSFLDVIVVFVTFSLVASIVYIINDIRDVEKDRLHERKISSYRKWSNFINVGGFFIFLLDLFTIPHFISWNFSVYY